MAKHLLDETAEFAMPRIGRHAAPDTGELEITQRMEPLSPRQSARQPRPDDDVRTR